MKKRVVLLLIVIAAALWIYPTTSAKALSEPWYSGKTQTYRVVYGQKTTIEYDLHLNFYRYIELRFDLVDEKGRIIDTVSRSIDNSMYESRVSFPFDVYTNNHIPVGRYKIVASIRYYSNGWKSSQESLVHNILVLSCAPTSVYNGVDYSMVYNYDYYMYWPRNSDVKAVYELYPDKAIEHFVKYGMRENRPATNASYGFSLNIYKKYNRDLREAFGDNNAKYYDHYIRRGYKEGRVYSLNSSIVYTVDTSKEFKPITKMDGIDYSLVYDYDYYIAHNPDVKNAYGDDDILVLRHFVRNGMREGRRAKETFDLQSYKNAYSDLRSAFGNDNKAYYLHYIRNGYRENRVTTGVTEVKGGITTYNGVDYSRVYDYTYYINHNPDVKRAFGNNEQAVLRHFVNYGMREGRQASDKFNLQVYKSRYADLRKAYGNNNVQYYMHYIKWGYNEKRKAN